MQSERPDWLLATARLVAAANVDAMTVALPEDVETAISVVDDLRAALCDIGRGWNWRTYPTPSGRVICERYSVAAGQVTTSWIAREALRALANNLTLANRIFVADPDDTFRTITVSVPQAHNDAFAIGGFIQPAARQLARLVQPFPRCTKLPLQPTNGHSQAEVTHAQIGLSLRFTNIYDITTDTYHWRFDMSVAPE